MICDERNPRCQPVAPVSGELGLCICVKKMYVSHIMRYYSEFYLSEGFGLAAMITPYCAKGIYEKC